VRTAGGGDVAHISVEEAPAWIEAHRPVVVDVREPSEYVQGHLPGAISIPQAELAVRLAEIPRDRELLVVCASGMRSLRSAGFLRALGFDPVTNLDGGTNGWIAANLPAEGVPA
jgi:rhodanese-related sulfurtransferase